MKTKVITDNQGILNLVAIAFRAYALVSWVFSVLRWDFHFVHEVLELNHTHNYQLYVMFSSGSIWHLPSLNVAFAYTRHNQAFSPFSHGLDK